MHLSYCTQPFLQRMKIVCLPLHIHLGSNQGTSPTHSSEHHQLTTSWPWSSISCCEPSLWFTRSRCFLTTPHASIESRVSTPSQLGHSLPCFTGFSPSNRNTREPTVNSAKERHTRDPQDPLPDRHAKSEPIKSQLAPDHVSSCLPY